MTPSPSSPTAAGPSSRSPVPTAARSPCPQTRTRATASTAGSAPPAAVSEVGGAGASYAIPAGGVTLYAQWTLIATDDYGFNAAGGAPTPASGSGLDGATVTLPAAPTQAGYTFAGWNDGTTTYGAGATYTLSSVGTPIVFTAQWGANATDAYSFNATGGTPTPTSGLGLDGATVTLPAAPTEAGYTFAGWNATDAAQLVQW